MTKYTNEILQPGYKSLLGLLLGLVSCQMLRMPLFQPGTGILASFPVLASLVQAQGPRPTANLLRIAIAFLRAAAQHTLLRRAIFSHVVPAVALALELQARVLVVFALAKGDAALDRLLALHVVVGAL